MAERKQIPIFESCYKITEYLKKNTDKDHPTTQAAMRKDETVSQYSSLNILLSCNNFQI